MRVVLFAIVSASSRNAEGGRSQTRTSNPVTIAGRPRTRPQLPTRGMRTMQKSAVLLLISVACAANAQRPSSKDAAVYEVKFQGVWTAQNHPIDYPKGGSLSLSGAHFSGVIGAPHNRRYAIFTPGALATPGLELLSHKGSK